MRRNIFIILVFLFSVVYSQAENVAQKQRIAKSYESIQEYEKALEVYRELHRLRPKDYTFIDGIKRNLIALERFEELTLFLEETFKNIPRSYNILGELSKIYYQLGKFDKAKETWRRILNINKKQLFYYTFVADIQFKLRLIDDAIETLLLARKNVGEHQTISHNLASFYRWRRDYKNAAKEFINLYFIRKNYFGTLMGTVLSFPDDSVTYTQVTDVIKNALAENQDLNLYKLLYNYQIRSKRFDEGFETSRIMDKITKTQGIEIFSFARTAFRENALGKAKTALEYLQDNYKEFFRSGEVKYLLAYTDEKIINEMTMAGNDSIKFTKYREVIRKYTDVTKKFKGQVWEKQAYFRIGEIWFNIFFDLDEAIKAFSAASQGRDITAYEASLKIGDCLLARGSLAGAQKIFDEKAKLNRKQLIRIRNTALFKSAKVDFYKGNFDTTLIKLENIINANPMNADLINDCIELKMIISDNIENYKSALILYAGAERLTHQKNYGEALVYLKEIAEKFKDSELAGYSLYFLGDISSRLNLYDDALTYFRRLVEHYPYSRYFEEAYKRIGMIYSDNLNRVEDAIRLYENFIVKYPNSMNVDYIRKKIRELEKQLKI